MATDSAAVQQALSTLDFPASKDQLVEHAEKHGADSATVHALRAIPVADYENTTEVVRSVTLDTGAEEGRSRSDKAQQARQAPKGGLAEHQTETPNNPIVEELGENRGS